MALINAEFTSEWDDGSIIASPCTFNTATKEVIAKSLDIDPNGSLVKEYITLEDGDELIVCPECHSFVMKTVMGEKADLSYGEYLECPDCHYEF